MANRFNIPAHKLRLGRSTLRSYRGYLSTLFLIAVAIILNPSSARANTDSPQGALDVAGILPGNYIFLDRAKQNMPRAEQPQTPAETAVSNVIAIMDLMKQASDTAAMLPPLDGPATEPGSAQLTPVQIPIPKSDTEIALGIACAVPQFASPKAPSAPPKTAASNVPTQNGRNARELIKTAQLLWPNDGLIYSTFNASRGKSRRHGAIDIVAPKGTPIAAAADGVVTVAANGGKNWSGYGRVVVIDHGNGVHTLYAHCDTTIVKMGQRVKQGEYIATVGRTGRASTDHCHFEVRVDGKKMDPLACLPSRPEMVKAHSYRSK